MRPDAFLISLLVFSFIIMVGSSVMVDMADNYDVEYDDNFNETYEISQELYNLSGDQKDSTIGGEIEDDDALDSAIKGATSALKLMTTPVQLVSAISEDIMLNIFPGEPGKAQLFSRYLITGITIMVVFALIYIYFRIRSW
jgi:hypothetical protein